VKKKAKRKITIAFTLQAGTVLALAVVLVYQYYSLFLSLHQTPPLVFATLERQDFSLHWAVAFTKATGCCRLRKACCFYP